MLSDIAINNNTQEIELEINSKGLYDIAFVTDSSYVKQKIGIKLKITLGECFIDTTLGIDWSYYLSNKNKLSELDTMIKIKIMEIIGVESILAYESSFDKNLGIYYISFTVKYNGNAVDGKVELQ